MAARVNGRRDVELSPTQKLLDARQQGAGTGAIVLTDPEPGTPGPGPYHGTPQQQGTPVQITPSVIHQFTMQSPSPSPIRHLPAEEFERKYSVPKADRKRAGWLRGWLRRIFCCLSAPRQPAEGEASSSDAVVLPPPPPPPFTPPMSPKVFKKAVIGPKSRADRAKKTLVLDLDETLVHSSFKPIPNPDYIIEVEIDGRMVDVYVLKRPWLDLFMETVAKRYEVVVFTASLSKYADPLLDLMDRGQLIRWRLFREACVLFEGNYVKDLNCLGRDLAETIIIDNSPHSYAFQPFNALPIGTFIDDPEDQELLEAMDILMKLDEADDVRHYLTANMQHIYNQIVNDNYESMSRQ